MGKGAKGLNATSGTYFVPVISQASCLFARVVVNWRSRSVARELKQRRRRRQRGRQKSYRVRLTKQQRCTCIMLFCTFLSRRCTATTWKCLISRFVEDRNTRQHLSFSFPELWYRPLEFNSKKVWQELTNWTRWNERDKVWGSANSLFKWRFRSRSRRRCLSSLIFLLGKWLFKLTCPMRQGPGKTSSNKIINWDEQKVNTHKQSVRAA